MGSEGKTTVAAMSAWLDVVEVVGVEGMRFADFGAGRALLFERHTATDCC